MIVFARYVHPRPAPLIVRGFLGSPRDITALCIALGHHVDVGSRRGDAFDALASVVLGRPCLHHGRRGRGFLRAAHAYPAAFGGGGGHSHHGARGDPLLDEVIRLLAAVHRDQARFEAARAKLSSPGLDDDIGQSIAPRGAASEEERRGQQQALRDYCSICYRSALSSLHLRVLALCLQRSQLGYATKVLARATHHARPGLLVARQRHHAALHSSGRSVVPLVAASQLAAAYALVIRWAAAHGASVRAAVSLLKSARGAGIARALGTGTWNVVLDALLLLPMALRDDIGDNRSGGGVSGGGTGVIGADNERAEVAFDFIGRVTAMMAQAGIKPNHVTNGLIAESLLKARQRARWRQEQWQQRELDKLARLRAARDRAAARDREDKEEREAMEERTRLESAQRMALGLAGRRKRANTGKGKAPSLHNPSFPAAGRAPTRQQSPRVVPLSRSPTDSLISAGSDEPRQTNGGTGRVELPAFVPKPPPNAPDEDWEAWRRACARAREAKGGRPYNIDRRYRHGRGGFGGGSNKAKETRGRSWGVVGESTTRRSANVNDRGSASGVTNTRTPPLAPRPPPGPQNATTLGPHRTNVWTEKLEQRLQQRHQKRQQRQRRQQPEQQQSQATQAQQRRAHRNGVIQQRAQQVDTANPESPSQPVLGAIGAGVIGYCAQESAAVLAPPSRSPNAGQHLFAASRPPMLVLEAGIASPPGFREQAAPRQSRPQQHIYGAAFLRASAAASPATECAKPAFRAKASGFMNPEARAFVPAHGGGSLRPPSPAAGSHEAVQSGTNVGFFGMVRHRGEFGGHEFGGRRVSPPRLRGAAAQPSRGAAPVSRLAGEGGETFEESFMSNSALDLSFLSSFN